MPMPMRIPYLLLFVALNSTVSTLLAGVQSTDPVIVSVMYLDASTGQPLKLESGMIFWETAQGQSGQKHTLTDSHGVATISIYGSSSNTTLKIYPDAKTVCYGNPNVVSFSLQQTLATGIVAANRCGKPRSTPVAGQITVYVRKMTFLEKMDM